MYRVGICGGRALALWFWSFNNRPSLPGEKKMNPRRTKCIEIASSRVPKVAVDPPQMDRCCVASATLIRVVSGLARSMSTHRNHVKIVFEVLQEDGTLEVESVWATKEARGFRLDNIPFIARGVALNDLVSARLDSGGAYLFDALIQPSGHSTVRVVFFDEGRAPFVRGELIAEGCSTELDVAQLLAVDVPPTVSFERIQSILDRYAHVGVLDYEESCIGQ